MSIYLGVLQTLTEASGDGKSYRQGEEQLSSWVKEGEVVAVRCPDNDYFYRTCYLKRNPFSGQLQKHVSNPVMGSTPDGMREVSAELFLKQFREMSNGSLKAFPFATGEPMS